MPQKSLNLQERVAERFSEEADKIAKAIAAAIGKPTDTQTVTTEEEIELWMEEGITQEEASELFRTGTAELDQILDMRYPNRRFMMTFQKPEPQEQIRFAERMKKATEGYKRPEPGSLPSVHNESAGELQSTVEPY